MEIAINYLAVLVSAIAAIALGSVWYGPLFGKAWMKEAGISSDDIKKAKTDPAAKKAMMRSYTLMAVASFVMAYVLAHALTFGIAYTGTGGIPGALMGVFWYWLGFVAPVALASVLWENRSWKYFGITAGYYLVSLAIMGSILVSWPA